MALVVLPQMVAAIKSREAGLMGALWIFLFLFLPCRDKLFGQGRPYFWLRQLCLILGSIITTVLALTSARP